MPLRPFTGTFGTAELRHLLRRTLFGATQEDLTTFQGKNLVETVDALLNISPTIGTPPVFFQKGIPLYTKDLVDNTPGDTTDSLTYNGSDTYPAKSALGMDWVTQQNSKQLFGKRPDGVAVPGSYLFTKYFSSNLLALTAWWSGNMLHQERTIKEKMILFLHNLVPMNPKNDGALFLEVYEYYKLLNKYALGNYKEFIFDMTFNPMMLRYLDGIKNKAGSVNENYARELQELFTVGKSMDDNFDELSYIATNINNPSYNPNDVAGIAKLLTGWSINVYWKCDNPPSGHDNTSPVKFTATEYNNDLVTLSGYYGNIPINPLPTNPSITGIQAAYRLKQALDVIFSKNDVAKHIVRRLYRYFVYSDITTDNLSLCSPNIEQNIISPLATTLKNKNYNFKVVLKELLTSEHFFEPINRGCMIKNPMDFVVGTLRTFKVDGLLPKFKNPPPPLGDGNFICSSTESVPYPSIARYTFWKNWVDGKCNEMNWGLLNAPDVAGLPAYHQASSYHQLWINADTVNKRKRFLGLKNDYTGLIDMAQNGNYTGFGIPKDPNSNSTQATVAYIPNFLNITKSIFSNLHPGVSKDDFINRLVKHFLAVRPNDTIISSLLNSIPTSTEWNNFRTDYNNCNTNNLQSSTCIILNNRLQDEFYKIIVSLEEFQLM